MKKFGFTLAEVLITLGIIGVVAALTAPALVQNAGTAKIGPTLSKVAATLENANEQLLHDEDATDLSKIAPTALEYYELLSKYISGSSYSNEPLSNVSVSFNPQLQPYSAGYESSLTILNKMGEVYPFYFSDNITLMASGTPNYRAKASFKGGYLTFYIDINGTKTKPNTVGKDNFIIWMDKNGSVIPLGGNSTKFLTDIGTYETAGTYQCDENNVTSGLGCAGSIFENNMKVIYK